MMRGVEHLGVGQRPVAVRLPAVDEDDPRTASPAPRGDEPCGEIPARVSDDRVLERQSPVGRGQPRHDSARQPGPDAVDDREPVREGERDSAERGEEARAARDAVDGRHEHRGRQRAGPVKRPDRAARSGTDSPESTRRARVRPTPR